MAMMPPQGMMAPEQATMPEQEMAPTAGININPEEFNRVLQNASEGTMQILEQHLTPGLKQALAELFGPEIAGALNDIGPEEPTVNIPVSVVASAYPAETIEDSVSMMGQDFASKGQQEIPSSPQGGLGGAPQGAPQTNVPPGPMPTGMV
jgi:hypothetical protein